jgi:hypothetical protein
MTSTDKLERRYRRLLALFPRAFRHEHEQEMLAVLMHGSPPGARSPGLGDSFDLIRNALWMQVRPAVPRSARTVFLAVRLMYLGAVLELCALAIVALTTHNVRSAVFAHHPALALAQWQTVVHGQLLPVEVGAAVAALLLLWIATANARGLHGGRVAFGALFALDTAGLAIGLTRGSAMYARADLAVGAIVWLVALATLVLIFSRGSRAHYARSMRLSSAVA